MRGARRLAVKLALIALGALLISALIVQMWFLSQVLWWSSHNPESTAFMRSRLERLRLHKPGARLEHRWVPYHRISVHLKRAVIAAEDAHFLEHEGFDWDAIQKAIEINESKGRVVAGASTISQQLAKNLFLSGRRSWLRKAQEAVITGMIEASMSKRRILELYLNVAEWGETAFGAEAAARLHFGSSAAALDAEQALWLAAILPSPRRLQHGGTTRHLAARIEVIRIGMPHAQVP
ncbi:MAG: monofunctional biosynthetic peptidoglycan transglycosylase [Betaproteobacteria bacterium]|nr:monofunctional biosynthetic peptidoglycan transglycosylase [Betaproteobacteria bacterium]